MAASNATDDGGRPSDRSGISLDLLLAAGELVGRLDPVLVFHGDDKDVAYCRGLSWMAKAMSAVVPSSILRCTVPGPLVVRFGGANHHTDFNRNITVRWRKRDSWMYYAQNVRVIC